MAYAFDHGLGKDALADKENYELAQVSDSHPNTDEDLSYMTNKGVGIFHKEFWFCYGNENLPATTSGYVARLKVIKVATWLAATGSAIDFTAVDAISGEGGSWDGSLSDVEKLRCDGFVELCFEFNGLDAWGKKVESSIHYDLSTYVGEHNDWQWGDDPEDLDDDMWTALQPVTQGGYADTYISEHSLGAGGPFRGTYWQTQFNKQRLVYPLTLTPESDTVH